VILPSLDRSAAAVTGTPGVAGQPWREVGLVGLTALTTWSAAVGWQAQAVSYPLYRAVAAEDFLAYHAQYNGAIPVVVIAPGFVAFLAGIALPWTRPAWVPARVAGLVAAAGAVSLVSTVAWAIPMHARLDRVGQDAATIDSLLSANLVRSVALTVGTVALAVLVGGRACRTGRG